MRCPEEYGYLFRSAIAVAALEHKKRFGLVESTGRLVAEHAAILLVGLRDVLEAPGRPQRLRHACVSTTLAATTASLVDSPRDELRLQARCRAIAILILGVLGILIFDGSGCRLGWERRSWSSAVVCSCSRG